MPVLGRPVLSLNLERIRRAGRVARILVATSTSPADDAIASVCEHEGIAVFRGSENDVLDRVYRCACEFGMTAFIHLTGDNPLIDSDVVDRVAGFFLASPDSYDYVSNNHPPTWPDGQVVEVVRVDALQAAWKEAGQSFQREHVTPYIWDQPGRFRLGNVARESERWHSQYRWTLDYREDYEFLRRVIEELYPGKPDFDSDDVVVLLQRRPDIQRINSQHLGSSWYTSHLAQLETVSSRPPGGN